MTTVENTESDLPLVTEKETLSNHFRSYIARVRGGDIGSLPAIIGLAIASTVFGILRPNFVSERNFANLFQQGAAVIFIAMGLVFVLLLGEIDLSAGFTSGVCAAAMAVLLTEHHWAWYWAVLIAIAIGVVTGLTLGVIVAKIRVPSFVVTLAAFLAFQGVQLKLLHDGQSVSIFDPTIIAINTNSMDPWIGWLMVGVFVIGYLAIQLSRRRSRQKRSLPTVPLSLIAIKTGTLLVIGGVSTALLNDQRSINPAVSSIKGVPIIVPIILVVYLILDFTLSRTPYGRHIYAVGGNAEAARRAGIRVDRIRISTFVICSTLAAISGIVAASRQSGVASTLGGSDVLLFAVGAAVIGGTSLFGGRGRVLDAILGGAVIAVISNGMDALNLAAGIKFIVTGLVLLAAATVDALSRRRAAVTGR